MAPSRKTLYRHRKAKEHAERGSGGLPMPYTRETMVTIEERAEYRARQDRHHTEFPEYATSWERPSPEAARQAYELAVVDHDRTIRLKDFVPPLNSIHPDPVTAMQLIAVALDVAVVSARYGHRQETRYGTAEEQYRHVKRAVNRNTLTDAIMRRWSDHARLARKEKRAYSVTQMIEATAKGSWRDLLVQNISLPVLWTLIAHEYGRQHPLFHPRGTTQWGTDGGDIVLHHGPTLRAFERLMRNDKPYRHSRVRHTWRFWQVGKKRPMTNVHDPICAERPYSVVTEGAGTKSVIEIQEQVQLLFDAPLFVADYRRIRTAVKRIRAAASYYLQGSSWSAIAAVPRRELSKKFGMWEPEAKLFRSRELKMRTWLLEFRSIYEQARPLKTPVLVRSQFRKVVNRRYQNLHLFTMQTSTKKDAPMPAEFQIELTEDADYFWSMVSTSRTRWFRAPDGQPLVELDISASQTQIQSVLLGIEAMEQQSILDRRPHKKMLAELAWTYRKGAVLSAPVTAVWEDTVKKIEQAARAHPAHGGSNENMRALLEPRHKLKERALKKDVARISNTDALPDLIVKSDEAPDGYTGPDDPRLVERVKNLWMLLGYGPLVQQIIRDQDRDPEKYGPGWRKRDLEGKARERAEAAGLPWKEQTLDVRGFEILLYTVPGYLQRKRFLDACKNAALALLTADPHQGAALLDPLDGAAFEWNQPLMAPKRLSLTVGPDRWEITLVYPGSYRRQLALGKYKDEECPKCESRGKIRGSHWKCRNWNCGAVWRAKFYPATPGSDGRLQVDDEKLRKMLAPCLVHTLDSLFSSYVMLALDRAGVKTFAGVHDCWILPAEVDGEPGYDVLDRAIHAAGDPWLLALSSMYSWLDAHLCDDDVKCQLTAASRMKRDPGSLHFYAPDPRLDSKSDSTP